MPADDKVPLPRITEVKRTLSGGVKRFECAVLDRGQGRVIVLFVAPEPMRVHGVELPAGTVTFGHFWTGRPYNVYHWLEQGTGTTIGHYVNLSAETRLSHDHLEWLDLIVDLLVLPDRPVAVLDEDEIPPDASPSLRSRIAEAKAVVLHDWPALVTELERHRSALWPAVLRAGEAAGREG